MKFTEYMPLALRTAKSLPHDEQVQHAQLGLLTEIGELADMVKRHVIYGKDLDVVNGKEELGDYCWYLGLYCHEQGIAALVIDEQIDKYKPQASVLMMATLMAGGLTGALTIDQKERGAPDELVVHTIVPILCELATWFGTTLGAALDTNIAKLAKRYGERYSDLAALNRDLAGERAVLEGSAGTDVDIQVG